MPSPDQESGTGTANGVRLRLPQILVSRARGLGPRDSGVRRRGVRRPAGVAVRGGRAGWRVGPLGSRVRSRGLGHLEQHEELEETAEGGREEPRVGDSHLEEERVEKPVAHVDERIGVEVGGARPARRDRAAAAVGPGPRGPGRRVLRHAAQRRALTARGSPRAPPGRHRPPSPRPRCSPTPGRCRRRHLPPPRPADASEKPRRQERLPCARGERWDAGGLSTAAPPSLLAAGPGAPGAGLR